MMLLDQPMGRVSSYRYFDDLSWSTHVEKINSKARILVGMLYRNFISGLAQILYLNFIRPHLEYAVHPYLAKDIHMLEAV